MAITSRIPGKEELFVGGLCALRNVSTLKENHITHVLSVMQQSLIPCKSPAMQLACANLQHMSIDVYDVEDENLLVHFPKMVRFVERGLHGDGTSQNSSSNSEEAEKRTGGAVLIHCAMGRSRSVAASMAYLLWKHPHRFGSRSTKPADAVQRALEWVCEGRKGAEPNAGFVRQLELWWEMGCPACSDDAVEKEAQYQRWAYRREVEEALRVGAAPERLRFEDEEGVGRSDGEDVRQLRCKKCRRVLATERFVVPHHGARKGPTQTPCPHVFIEPLSWMRPILEKGSLEGRLSCPALKCGAAVGRYSWRGFRCSCGEWVNPTFSLQRSRIDEIFTVGTGGILDVDEARKRRMAALGIRLPPGRAGEGESSGDGGS